MSWSSKFNIFAAGFAAAGVLVSAIGGNAWAVLFNASLVWLNLWWASK